MTLRLVVPFILSVATCSAQDARLYRDLLYRDLPIAKLPAGITGEAGKVSLVADFVTRTKPDVFDVYLINLSDHDIYLEAQDFDVYLKLETQSNAGNWVRAQAHAFSWCGNSYTFKPTVRKQHFYRISGYQPAQGRKAKIRFRLYEQPNLDIVSQVGDGLVSDTDISISASDALAVSSGDFDSVCRVALGETRLVNRTDHIRDLQGYAISVLASGRFPEDNVFPVLDVIATKFPDRKEDLEDARTRLTRERRAEQDGAHQPATRPASEGK
jgi:hypothetical protein